MIRDALLLDLKFWQLIDNIEKINNPTSMDVLFSKCALTNFERTNVIYFLESVGYKIEGDMLLPSPNVRPGLSDALLVFFEFFAKKDAIRESDIAIYSGIGDKEKELLKILEKNRSRFFDFTISGHKSPAFLHLITFLGNNIGIITENESLKNLNYYYLKDIDKLEGRNKLYHPMYTELDIEKLISELRDSNEERLVLRLSYNYPYDIRPLYQLTTKAALVAAANGNKIWSMNLERSLPLYEWLYAIKDYVDILSPSIVIKEFQQFLEGKDCKK